MGERGRWGSCAVSALLCLVVATPSGASDEVRLESFLPDTEATALVQATDGNFYGTAWFTAVIFRVTPAGAYSLLHTLNHATEGYFPGRLIQATDGNFYGTTSLGGPGSNGTFYRMTPAGNVTVLHAFDISEGEPAANNATLGSALLQASDGNFYGTTTGFITDRIFRMTPSGVFTTLVNGSFSGCPLIEGTDGNLYGSAIFALFRLSFSGQLTVIHDFSATASVDAGLLQGADGNFYGVTGPSLVDQGTVFQLSSQGTFTVLHRFAGGDGRQLSSELIQGRDGYLYGTALAGGVNDGGTLFRLTTDGAVFQVLHTFIESEGNGASPGTILQAHDGRLYGTTTSGQGPLFRLSLTPAARMNIDLPRHGESVSEPFGLQGWAFDSTALFGPGLDTIQVYAYAADGSPPLFVGAAQYGGSRPDVGGVFGSAYTNSGFGLTVRGLPSGAYWLVAFPHSSTWNLFDYTAPAVVSVTIQASQPRTVIDAPRFGTSLGRSFSIGGWSLDLGAINGPGTDVIHIYAYKDPGSGTPPVFLGAATFAGRPDVAAVFGQQFTNSGWGLSVNALAPGSYLIVVYARSTVSWTFSAASTFVTVR